MLRPLRKRWYRRHSPKTHYDYPRRIQGVAWAHMFLLVQGEKEKVVEWFARDPMLPVRFEKNIRLRPRGSGVTQ